jgi:hypothetical protein
MRSVRDLVPLQEWIFLIILLDGSAGIRMTILVQNRLKWLFSQLGQLIIAVGLISIVFNYAYRYLVDWSISSPLFYISTLIAAFIVFLAFRRDYIFVNRFEFGEADFDVYTLLGSHKNYPLSEYKWVPSLHKVVNLPENKAALSFSVVDRSNGRSIRNYSWAGFSSDDFRSVSQMYGYRGDTDFKQRDFGRV